MSNKWPALLSRASWQHRDAVHPSPLERLWMLPTPPDENSVSAGSKFGERIYGSYQCPSARQPAAGSERSGGCQYDGRRRAVWWRIPRCPHTAPVTTVQYPAWPPARAFRIEGCQHNQPPSLQQRRTTHFLSGHRQPIPRRQTRFQRKT